MSAIVNQPPGAWGYFLMGPEACDFFSKADVSVQKDRYEILEIVPVTGESPVTMKTQGSFFRFETSMPTPSLESEAQWKGNVRHLQYTPAAVRTELQKRSVVPYPALDSTLAVLISSNGAMASVTMGSPAKGCGNLAI